MSTETKVFGAIILVGAVFLLSREETSVPEGEIVSRRAVHWHPRLTIYIKGEKQEIPADLGLGPVHAEIHTHKEDNSDGVVHLEMKGVVTKNETRLARFFQLWGKELSPNCIFDKCNGAEGTVKMIVSGQENKEFENYLMKDGDIIEIHYE